VPKFPLIAVDVGNSRVHFGYFPNFDAKSVSGPTLTFSYLTAEPDFAALQAWLPNDNLPWHAVSVHRQAVESLRRFVRAELQSDFQQLTHVELGLATSLPNPEKIGADRLAAALVAKHMKQPDFAAIVVDAGTAITVDVVSPEGVFQGGAILPGMRVIAKALAHETDMLPEVMVGLQSPPDPIGTNTTKALQSGLYWGAVGAVRETIARTRMQLATDSIQLFLAGGDVKYLAQWMDGPLDIVSDIVLRGVALSVVDQA